MLVDLHSQEELNDSVTGNCKQILHEFFIAFSDWLGESFSVRCKLLNTSCGPYNLVQLQQYKKKETCNLINLSSMRIKTVFIVFNLLLVFSASLSSLPLLPHICHALDPSNQSEGSVFSIGSKRRWCKNRTTLQLHLLCLKSGRWRPVELAVVSVKC